MNKRSMMVSDRAKTASRMTRPPSANTATVSAVGETRPGRLTRDLPAAADLSGAECVPANPRAGSSHPHGPSGGSNPDANALVAGSAEQGKVRGLRLEVLGHHVGAKAADAVGVVPLVVARA